MSHTAINAREPSDPRVRRTRANLLAAFNQLFLEHGYEAITPARIAAEAGVGRSTFYEHHQGKEALLRHSVTALLRPLAETAVGHEASPLAPVLRHFWENRRLAARFLADRPGRIVRDRLAELIADALQAGTASCAVPLSLLAVGLAAAQLALIEAWLGGHHSCTADQLARAMRNVTLFGL